MNVAAAVPIVALFLFYVIPTFEHRYLEGKKGESKIAVALVSTMLEGLAAQVEAKTLDDAAARKLAIDLIRKMRYSGGEYVFATDENLIMRAHPRDKIMNADAAKMTDGPNSSNYHFVELMKRAKEGGGFHEYQGTRPGDDELRYPKIAYAQIFPKWGWMVASGVYLDEVRADLRRFELALWLALAVVLGASVAASTYFARRLSARLNSLADVLRNGSDEVSGAAGEISAQSNGLSASATQQASALGETASAIEQLSASVQRNAEGARESQARSAECEGAVSRGKRAVGEVIGAIERIRDENARTMGEIEANYRDVEGMIGVISDIRQKTQVINDIVFQTKLLSFNASVEAARAGEHGKSFAVVAEEVGNLAEMSGNAAKEISSMLEAAAQRVGGIVNGVCGKTDRMVEDGKRTVEEGTQIAQRCRGALDEVVTQVSAVASRVGEIAAASAEQATGIRSISQAIGELDQVTQKNAAAAHESAASSEELSAQATSFRHVVSELSSLITGEEVRDPAATPARDFAPTATPGAETHAPGRVPRRVA